MKNSRKLRTNKEPSKLRSKRQQYLKVLRSMLIDMERLPPSSEAESKDSRL
jgi:hypothetical protein